MSAFRTAGTVFIINLSLAKEVETVVELQIDSGIELKRIKTYFKEEMKLVEKEENVYFMDNCKIILENMPNKHGLLKLPRTLVRFVGEEEICKQQQHLFRMRFLSAGG